MSRLTRRQALRAGTGLLAVGVAGCTSDDGNGSSDGDGSTPSEGGDNSDETSDEDESTSNKDSETSGDGTTSLAVGESYTNPIGSTLTVTDIELQETVEAQRRRGDEGVYQREAAEGEQWAVVTVEITNDSGQTQYLTPVFEIIARANGTEYNSTAIKNDEDAYSPAEVQDGESRSGWLAYGVPAELTVADIEVVHSNSADGESWTVIWSDS